MKDYVVNAQFNVKVVKGHNLTTVLNVIRLHLCKLYLLLKGTILVTGFCIN